MLYWVLIQFSRKQQTVWYLTNLEIYEIFTKEMEHSDGERNRPRPLVELEPGPGLHSIHFPWTPLSHVLAVVQQTRVHLHTQANHPHVPKPVIVFCGHIGLEWPQTLLTWPWNRDLNKKYGSQIFTWDHHCSQILSTQMTKLWSQLKLWADRFL